MSPKNGKVVMAKLGPLNQATREFDLEFWGRVGPEGRFAAAWDMVCEFPLLKGKHAYQSRLQRSVASFRKRTPINPKIK